MTRVIAIGVLLVLGLSACQTPSRSSPEPSAPPPTFQVTVEDAARIAREFVRAAQPSETLFVDLTNDPPQVDAQGWRVSVNATVVPAPSTPEVKLHYVLAVDGTTGGVTIIGQS